VEEFFEKKMPQSTSSSSLSAATSKDVVNGAELSNDSSKKKSPKALIDKPTSLTANLSNLFRRKSPSPKSPEPPQLKTPDDNSTHRSPDGERSAIAEAEEDEHEERPSPSGFRRPPGAVGVMGGAMPGMGGGLMSELKKKQRQSAMPVVSSSDSERLEHTIPPAASASSPTHKVVHAYGSKRPPSLFPRNQRDSVPTVTAAENLNTPKPAARRSVSPNDAAASGDKPNKPPPPLKPRPVVKPRPTRPNPPTPAEVPMRKPGRTNPAPGSRTSVRAYLRRFQDPEDSTDGNDKASDGRDSRESSPSTAIKKRGSVRERARFLDNNNKPGSDSSASSSEPSCSKTLPRKNDPPKTGKTESHA